MNHLVSAYLVACGSKICSVGNGACQVFEGGEFRFLVEPPGEGTNGIVEFPVPYQVGLFSRLFHGHKQPLVIVMLASGSS